MTHFNELKVDGLRVRSNRRGTPYPSQCATYHLFQWFFGLLLALTAVSAGAQQRIIVNPSFEGNDPAGAGAANYQIYTNGAVSGWDSTSGYIELWDNGFQSVPAYDGSVFAEMNAYAPGALYQNICMVSGETVAWTFAHRARSGGPANQTANFQVANNSGSIIQTLATQVSTTANQVWNVNTGAATYTGPSGVQRVQFTTTDAGSVGNFLDDIRIQLNPFIEFNQAANSGIESVASNNVPALLIDGTLYSSITVNVTITGGSATRGVDYTTPNGNATFTVTIPAGTYARTTVPLGITIIDDALIEGSETITMSLGAGAGYTLSGSASCGATATTAATYTITDNDSAITFSKNWVAGKTGDAVNLVITGATTATAGNSTVGGAATNATGAATSGMSITVTESYTTGSSANYTTTFDCRRTTDNSVVTTSGTGLARTFTMPASGGVVCTVTNTRKSATLLLQKTWNGAVIGHTVDLTTSGFVNTNYFNSVANAANETDAGPTTVIYAGSVGQINETFVVGSAANYITTLSCTGNAAALSGNTLTVSATDSAIICTYTNRYITPLTMTKASAVVSDPVNGTTNPKMIPGAFVDYTLTINNPGSSAVTSNSIFVVDVLPSQVALYVNALTPAAGPVVMTPNSSTLTYSFVSLASMTDDVDFSNNGGVSWTYVPTPNANGVDLAVNAIRINPKGAMAAASSFVLRFRTWIR